MQLHLFSRVAKPLITAGYLMKTKAQCSKGAQHSGLIRIKIRKQEVYLYFDFYFYGLWFANNYDL